jgi:hypothetical protein
MGSTPTSANIFLKSIQLVGYSTDASTVAWGLSGPMGINFITNAGIPAG